MREIITSIRQCGKPYLVKHSVIEKQRRQIRNRDARKVARQIAESRKPVK